MDLITHISDMKNQSTFWKKSDLKIGFVPTMGALHEGHLSLVEIAKQNSHKVVMSIFVNPTQFGPNEDLDSYPRQLEKDLEMAKEVGVDLVFNPTVEEMYPKNSPTLVDVGKISETLCGASRPGHFRGVATVVLKLFNIVQPNVAIFGNKDFQQLQVIRQMTRDFDLNIEIMGAPTVRESDGLAMSSRNKYLSVEERQAATILNKALRMAQKMVMDGENESSVILKRVRDMIEGEKVSEIEYASICNPETLKDVDVVRERTLLALAVNIGSTRLIDNSILETNEKTT